MTLQDEIHAWHRRNYPKDDAYSALLGLAEEIGELNRAELKQEGGIRGTWDEWQAEKHKEAGDVLISILNFAGYRGVKMEEAMLNMPFTNISCPTNAKLGLLLISVAHGKVVENALSGLGARLPGLLVALYRDVECYCISVGFNPTETLESRWKTISQRDFIANPATGGRENEK